MSEHKYYTLYEIDDEGKFTKPVEALTASYYRPEDISAMNAQSIVMVTNFYEHWQDERPTVREYPRERFQWARHKDPEWRHRERNRFVRGEYSALPWDLDEIPDHFAHISMTDTVQIAYTPSPEKGEIDAQVKMRPGRYLTKFYPHLDANKIRELAVLVDKAGEVRFASTPDEIVHVYTNGPSSCMSHSRSHFSSSVHPAHVYGAGDLQVAYLASSDTSKASARCLVRPGNMTFGRIYGDQDRLRPALEQLGYKDDWNGTLGAKLLRIEDSSDCFVVPYLDGISSLRDDGTHLIIEEGGGIDASSTNGLSSDPDEDDDSVYCPYLGHNVEEGTEFYFVYDRDENWSQAALDDGAIYYCDGNQEYYSNAMPSYDMADGLTWSQSYFQSYGFTCPRTDDNLPSCEGILLRDTGEMVSREWADENAFQDDGEYYAVAPTNLQEAA